MADRFKLDETLGEGAFGKVYKVSDTKDGAKYAMKVIDLSKSPEDEKQMALDEAALLKKLKHENVLSYTDSFEEGGSLCIVTEYCSNGDLSQYLERRNKQPLEEDRLVLWFKQIASAVEYLHGQKIIHRDLKTPNVFLTEGWDTKLGDLGLAKVLERPNAKAVTFCGSPYYMSPEIFSCRPYDSKSDIWALGVIVYEMATLERPFDAMLMHQLVFKIVHGGLPQMPDKYSPHLPDILSKMMQKDTDKRPTAEDILRHPLFKSAKAPKAIVPPAAKKVGGAVGGRWAHFLGAAAGNDKKVVVAAGGASPRAADGAPPGAGGGASSAVKVLLGTLSRVRQKNEEKDRLRRKEEIVPGISSIMATTYIDKGNDFDKTLKQIPQKSITSAVASTSDVKLTVGDELNATLRASGVKTEEDAFNVMQMVVRTLTGIFHGRDIPTATGAGLEDPQTMLLRQREEQLQRQIEQLQYYCIKVLDKNMQMFQNAYDMMSTEKDEKELEGKLIGIIGREKFAVCGIQFMYLKNFEYNLHKLGSQH